MVAVMEGRNNAQTLCGKPHKSQPGKAQGKPVCLSHGNDDPAELDPRRQALLLYFQGYRIARIAEMLGEKAATVHSWKNAISGAAMVRLTRCSSPRPRGTAS